MPFSKLKKIIQKTYGAPLALRFWLPPERRHIIYKNLLIACAFIFILALTSLAIEKTPLGQAPFLSFFGSFANRIYGLFLIIFSIASLFSMFEAMHRSYYFKGLDQVLKESTDVKYLPVSWEVATLVSDTDDDDITAGLLDSDYGQEILYRAGISKDAFSKYYKKRNATLNAKGFIVERDKGVVLSTYIRSIYKQDEDFRQFLTKNNINENHLLLSAEWVTSIERKERKISRWWSKDSLGRIQGFGKTWSYGQTYYLERYGHDMTEDHIWQTAIMTRHDDQDDEVEELEQILSRNRQSNAILLTNDALTARQKMAQLYYKIRKGIALPPIEHKRVFLLDIEAMIMNNDDKGSFERQLIKTFNQAVAGGDIILYIENLASAIASANALNVDIIDTISPYFESPEIQIVVGETVENYNKKLSKDSRIPQVFDVIQMKNIKQDGLLDLLKQRAYAQEKYSNITFTIPALQKIAILADRYFPTGVMPDKAFDLLEELVPYAISNDKEQILQTEVEEFVSRKTNVPIGKPKKEEREKLLSLEDFLHKRVIAQDKAISAISKAIRRARAGISNPNKPMGTFLFLGPTGVGKTETAKALAEVLFGDENAMTRIDMSEFQSENAIEELIGSFETGRPGRLETLVRKRQYGVLLLDEFEKSDKKVHDLFLQIFDEGHFTTSNGNKVNMKNLIIIATSNAGASLIWKLEKKKKSIPESKKLLIDYMIKNNLYKPELLNRFDEVIIFHTLKMDHVKKIARIHINNFAKRIEKEQNIKLIPTDDLIDLVVKKGYDPQFGGRPLERAITEIVQQAMADAILRGELHPGDTFRYKRPKTEKQEKVAKADP